MAREIEEFQAKLTAKDEASKVIKEAAKEGEKFEKEEFEAELKLDGGEFEKTAEDLQGDIKAILDQARKKPELDLDASKAKGELDSLDAKMRDVQGSGEGLTGGAVNSLSDLTGPLGDVSGQVSEFGQAFVGAAEIAGPALSKVGLDVGKFAGMLGVGGVALGAVVYFWNTFVGGADRAKAGLKDVQEAMASGDFAAAAKGITEALAPWRTTMDDVGVSVQAATKFITGQTDILPLNAAAVEDATSKEHFLARELQNQRGFWEDNHGDLEQAQLDQFNATKAIGGTTQAFMDQAENALPEVQKQILAYVAMTNGIPESKFTEITTDANPDDVAQVQAELDKLAEDRDATVNVDADLSAAEARLRGFISSIQSQTRVIPVSAAPSSASSAAAAGPAVGPMAMGARSAPAAGGTVVNYNVTVNVPVGTPTAEVGRFVADALDAHERRSGSRRRVA